LLDIFGTPGRGFALAILGLLVLVRALDPVFLQTIALRGFDREQQIAPRTYQPLPVRIVAIDEKSLSRYGQWPWPRTLVAKLVRQIAAAHPRVLGVDIIFAEPDRLSPGKLVDAVPELPAPLAHQLSLLPANEAALAAAFKELPAVLGIGASDKAEPPAHGPSRSTIIRESGADPRPFLIAYSHLLRSVPELTAVARGQGSVLDNPDPDGITRRLPLFIVSHSQLIPALTLEMLRVALGAGTLGILTAKDGVQGGSVSRAFIPTDARGRVYPHFTPSYEIRYISAADLLDRSYDSAALRNGIVLLGVVGQGLIDERETPLGLMAGVEVQAQLIECILAGQLLRRPAKLDWIEIALILAAGLTTIFALPYRRPRIASAAFVALILLLSGGAFGCFRFFNLLVDAVYPSLSSIVTFGVMLGASLRAAEAARRHLAVELEHEREIEARLEGELSAARSIQMGLLPHRFPGPPERGDVEIYALIEPARMVGGDLYDFLLLDSRRLFFAIADVSGKGVPAALFMAMTKEVLRDALARHGEALDRVFAEANAKISASGGDMADAGRNMMFVTACAGIVDLASGVITYVNAGHDSPFLLRAATEPLELTGAGGPPLGTIEDFQYPVERHQLAPGDLLLLYTDGVTEAENKDASFYTVTRLKLLLRSAPSVSAKALVEFVSEDISRFAAGAEQADDITLLAVRWTCATSAAD
jgi:serine phosphatase RsbU (regulator of sigma subunit)